jgi:hypothetical protein
VHRRGEALAVAVGELLEQGYPADRVFDVPQRRAMLSRTEPSGA